MADPPPGHPGVLSFRSILFLYIFTQLRGAEGNTFVDNFYSFNGDIVACCVVIVSLLSVDSTLDYC